MNDAQSVCVSKQRYESLSIAIAVAHDYLVNDGVKSIAYLCPNCRGYHLKRQSFVTYRRAKKKIFEKIKVQSFNYHRRKHKRRK